MQLRALGVVVSLGLMACTSSDDPVVEVPDAGAALPDVESADTPEPSEDSGSPEDTAEPVDAAADVGAPEEDVAEPADVGEPDAGPVEPERVYAHRAIGGVSMGAAGARLAIEHPDLFDTAGALGGYISIRYMVSTGRRLHMAGFCPLEQLEANADSLNDIDADPAVYCGPGTTLYDLEYSQDFNHLHYDTNGASFDRRFYIDVFKALSLVFGNFTSEPSGESPYLPRGVDEQWFANTSPTARCADAPPVTGAHAFNAEYNPEGTYSLIPVCDSDKRELPGLGEADFDPTVTHDRPTDILLAVDINGNGVRDYGEPVVFNAQERFEDVGSDGCGNALEDGEGGCLAEAGPETGTDPNGDDYHWASNPLGTETNDWWDEGEPFSDLGFDGVGDTQDPGEGNGTFDRNSALQRAEQLDVPWLISQLSDEALESLDLYFDSGIRDPLHAAVSTRRAVGQLLARDADAVRYQGIAGRDTAYFPDVGIDDVVNELSEVANFAPEVVGKHVYVEYGDPNASQALIDAGDGAHVGTNEQVLARLLLWYAFALHRLPDPDLEPASPFNSPENKSYYSPSLGARRNYSVVLPPGYEQNPDQRYPVLFVLHGLGQSAADFANVAFVTSGMMSNGALPKAIQVYVDGTCCYARKDDHSVRECACGDSKNGVRACIEPSCDTDHESCEVRDVSNSEIENECVRASLYFDLLANRWGEPRSDMKYGNAVIDLVEHIDATYRTRSGPNAAD